MSAIQIKGTAASGIVLSLRWRLVTPEKETRA